METGKPGLVRAPARIGSVPEQTAQRMDVQAPLTAVYIHTVPALPQQPFPKPPSASQEQPTLRVTMPPLYCKETLPFLTLHIAGGLQPGPSMTSAAPAVRPKSAGKHVCPHCGRDCMKPSVLEKHLRCHTGERPYPCTVCGVSFKTQSNLYKHKRTQAHARLSSESEQSNPGSLDSMSSSSEMTSLSVEECSDECNSVKKDTTLPVTDITPVVTIVQTFQQNEQTSVSQKTQENTKLTKEGDKQAVENEQPTLSSSRHLPLQRQEATLFSKQWESSMSSGKSQSHESTDSGFSESSDHYPSPGSVLPDHSMDSLTESTTEHLEDSTNQEAKDNTKEQEQKTLEERISKLISENSVVVEDKHLENVRPRKMVLSKQGSIDLPMPYTYKDSFHFDMRINKVSNVHRNRKPGLYNSFPTQQSISVEHAPLIRSNSFPFSVTFLQPERSSPTPFSHRDYATLFRRGSSGQIHPTGFSINSVNQQSSTHRPLVRQAAVDCNHATDALFKNSSVEEECTSSLRCDGEAGDICVEPSNRKFQRKKSQKFAYNKWYMYGGGTFKKLYETERGGENSSSVKGRRSLTNPDNEVIQSLQKRLSAGHNETTSGSSTNLARRATVCHPESFPARLQLVPSLNFNAQTDHIFPSDVSQRMSLQRNLSLSVLPLSTVLSLTPNQKVDTITRSDAGKLVNELTVSAPQSQVQIPSDRKKQRTDDKLCPQEMNTAPNAAAHLPSSVINNLPQPNLNQISIQPNPKHSQASLFRSCIINTNAPSVSNSTGTSSPSTVRASFMPKYQLKLPNAAESHSSSSPVGTTPMQTENSICVCTAAAILHPNTSTLTSTFSSVSSQILPCTMTAPSQTPGQVNVCSPLAVVHQRPVADTKTTTSLRNSHAGLCSTLIHFSPLRNAVPLPKTGENEHVLATPVTSVHRTQSSPAALTAFPQNQQRLPSQINSQLPLTQSQSNGSSGASNIPLIPCQVIPGQQAAPNVFHVHTADLQICLQIISDEQLALIEPQIERQADNRHSQTGQVEAISNHVQNQVQSCMISEKKDKEKDYGESEPSKEMHTITKDIAKPLICNNSEKVQKNIQMTQAAGESPTLSTHPHIYSQVNKLKKLPCSEGDEVSAAASLENTKSETPEKELAHSLNFAAQEHFVPDLQKSHCGRVSHVSDKHKLSPATVTSIGHCSGNNGKTNCKEVLCCVQNSSFKNKSSCSVQQVGTACVVNETWPKPVPCRRSISSFVSVCCSSSQKFTLPHANPEKMGLSHGLTPSEENAHPMISKSHDTGSEQPALVTSESTDVQLAVLRDVPEASTNIPNINTGLEEGGCLDGSVEPQSQGHPEAPDLPGPEQSHVPERTERDGFTYIQLQSKAEDAGVRVDSFPHSWLSDHHLLHHSRIHSGMYLPQSSGAAPDPSNSPGPPANSAYTAPQSSLQKSNCYLSQHTEGGTDNQQTQVFQEASLNKEPYFEQSGKTLSHVETGQQMGIFQQDQRCGAENSVISCSSSHRTIVYTSQNHTGPYPSNSLVLNNPRRPSNITHNEHISRDNPPQSCESPVAFLDCGSKYQSLFGATQVYSYQQVDPLRCPLRPIQSGLNLDDSSSDDEGKLIIEL